MSQRLRSIPWTALEPNRAEVLSAVREHLAGAEGARVISRLLRANRHWSAHERTAAVETVWGVGLWRRRLAQQVGLPDDALSEGDSPVKLVYALVHGLGGLAAEAAARCADLPKPLRLGPPPEHWPERLSCPDPLARVLQHELGAEAEAFLEAINEPGPVVVRANALRIDRAGLAELLAAEGIESSPTRYSPWGLRLHGRPNIYGSRAHQRGLFEVQDEGSQLLSALLQVSPGETVLDLCAGAGGKTLHLAALMENRGTLYAWDPDASRLERLRLRAERAGVRNLKILDARRVPTGGAEADRVLVDAPCSSLGALRRGPDQRFRIDPSSWEELPERQAEILARGGELTRMGGRVLYATCTLRRAENEEVVEGFLARNPHFSAVKPPWKLGGEGLEEGGEMSVFFRALPHRHGSDGFFAALFRRGGSHRTQS